MRCAHAKTARVLGDAPYTLGPLVSGAALMGSAFALLGPTSRTQTPVHLCGESGTGKQTLAFAIHLVSGKKPLATVRCTGLGSATELRHLLIGDGTPRAPGAGGALFRARKGTLLLLDIGGLGPESQTLLVALLGADMRFRGGRLTSVPGPRLVSTSSQDLEALVRQGRFRSDLFYRLAGAVVQVPPLRKRREDIPDLARLFLSNASSGASKSPTGFTFEGLELLLGYSWPGNVRQLRTVVEAAAAHAAGEQITHASLGHFLARPVPPTEVHIPVGTSLREAEMMVIRATLAAHSGCRQSAADALGIARRTLYQKLSDYKLQERGDEAGQGGPVNPDPQPDGPPSADMPPRNALMKVKAEVSECGPASDNPLKDVLADVSTAAGSGEN